MNHYLKLLLLCLTAVFLIACSPSRSFTKKANKLAAAGLHDEASLAYMQALGYDRTNIDARIGLRTSAQLALNNYLDRFYRAHGQQQYKESVYAFIRAEKFYQDVSAFNIELEMPTYYKQAYEEDLEIYLNGLYEEGSRLMVAQKFSESEGIFREINTLKPGFRDVGSLKKMSIIIPAYDAGRKQFEAENYRRAHGYFEEVFKLEPNYKDVAELRRVSRERATLTVAVMPFENSNAYSYSTNLTSFIVSELSRANNDFLVIIDREHTEKILREQKFSLQFGGEQSNTLRAGELMGARLLLTGRILDMGISNPTISHKEKTGYESYRERIYNAEKKRNETITRYRKVMYSEFNGSSAVRLKVQYQLISAESGTVLLSDVFEERLEDEVRYISYEGNAANLFAGTWRSRTEPHPSDRVLTSFSQKREVDQLVNGKRDFRPMNDMLVDVQSRISSQMANQLVQFEMQRAQ
ncbi:MAG: CsgG/HfaB family protein [Bacteroidia bacterium]